jgi:hypothetical protein
MRFSLLPALLLISSIFLGTACTSTMHIRALAPAAVQMPDNLQRIATAKRVLPASGKDKFYDVLEGIFTGEGPGVDRAGADECVNVVGQALAHNSFRFQVTQAQLQLQGKSREFFLEPLPARQVQDVCRRTQVDGLVVLEAFDSDMGLTRTTGERTYKDKEGKEHKVPTVRVEMVMKIVTGFRTYSAAQGFIVDQAKQEDHLAFAGEGDTYQEALRQLPPPDECIRRVAQVAGDKYARRIAPSYVHLVRSYFTGAKKDALMRQANIRADAADWQGAAALWQQAAKNLDPKVAGRAFYNLAVASEARGNLAEAVEWAKKSAYTCENRAARSYLRELQFRQQEHALIEEQLKSLPSGK